MKKNKKNFIRVMGFVAILLIAGFLYKNWFLKRALPDYNGNLKCEQLGFQVEVYRDTFAVPHIIAKNENDLYFVTGYLTAQDRLWQMDVLRRVTQGRLSEIFGEKTVSTDLLMRMLRISEKSRRILSESDSALFSALTSYANGVNFYINQNVKRLPPEFRLLNYIPEPWEAEHSINLIGYIAWDLNGSWNSEILLHQAANVLSDEQLNEFIPKMDEQDKVIFTHNKYDNSWRQEMLATSECLDQLGMQVFHGSNNWVVSGPKSETGKPLLANDMHLGFRAPGIWYQIHQTVKDKLDVTGVLLPGQPFVISGHNASIAWGLTNVMNDDIDFYRETVNPADSSLYKLDGKWVPFTLQNEIIKVKDKQQVNATIKFTHRGPVVSGIRDIKGEVISMRWVGNEPSNEVKSIFLINRASNWDEFKDAMKTFVSVSQNVAYADRDGNIGMYCCAGIPIRKTGNPIDVFPGDTSASDWQGMVPFNELPHEYNPATNFAISANNRTIGPIYPYYISYWFDLPYRYNRIRQLIERKSKLSLSDFADIQTDQVSNFAHQYLPGLIKILSEAELSGTIEHEVLEALKKWDGAYSKDDFCAAIFEGFYNNFINALVYDELGEKLFDALLNDKIVLRNLFHNTWINKGNILCDNVGTPKVEVFNDLVQESFRKVINDYSHQMGDNYKKWKWGSLHAFAYNHPMGELKILDIILNLNRGPFPVGGSFHTVAPFTYRYDKPYTIRSGASQRHIYDLADWDNSLSVIPGGNSGIPASKHYCDQLSLYLNGKYHPDLFSEVVFKKNAKYYKFFEP